VAAVPSPLLVDWLRHNARVRFGGWLLRRLAQQLLLVANYLLGGYVAMSVLLMLISAGVRFIAFGGKPTDHN